MEGSGGMPLADEALLAGIRAALAAHADPARAQRQQRYMKSRLPYYGVANPLVALICRELFSAHRIDDPAVWETTAVALWDEATHREEWYAAIALLRHRAYRSYAQSPDLLVTLRHLITTGAWWDVVDDVAAHLVGDLLRARHVEVAPVIREWAGGEDLWLRRAAIICQLRSNADTDTALLADTIGANFSHTGFFVRKAIGWALRDYARTDPVWVGDFVAANEAALSPLSRREALKHLAR